MTAEEIFIPLGQFHVHKLYYDRTESQAVFIDLQH